MLARDAPGRLTMLECRFNKTTHHPVSRYDIRVVQSPSDCILRSVLPLCRLRSDVSGPPSLTPWVSVVARQTPPRPCLNQWVRMAEGRVSRLVRSPASLGSLSATREHHLAAEA